MQSDHCTPSSMSLISVLCCSGSYEEEDKESCRSGSYEQEDKESCCSESYEEEDKESYSSSYEEEDKEGSEEYLSRDLEGDDLEEQQEIGQGWQPNLQGMLQHCGKLH